MRPFCFRLNQLKFPYHFQDMLCLSSDAVETSRSYSRIACNHWWILVGKDENFGIGFLGNRALEQVWYHHSETYNGNPLIWQELCFFTGHPIKLSSFERHMAVC